MAVGIKICGVNSRDALDASVRAGVDMCGFVLFPPSPRNIAVETAAAFVRDLPAGIRAVVLTVDADDALIDRIRDIVRPGYIQAHGKEPPARIAEISARARLPVIKALPVSARADLDAAAQYAPVADMLMFDARPPKGADRPGGFGHAFDWSLLTGARFSRPWLLAGGLAPGNVAEAIRISGAPAVDVSSGVESAPGVKDPGAIAAFAAAARGGETAQMASAETSDELGSETEKWI